MNRHTLKHQSGLCSARLLEGNGGRLFLEIDIKDLATKCEEFVDHFLGCAWRKIRDLYISIVCKGLCAGV